MFAVVSDQLGFLFMFAMWQIVNGWNCRAWFVKRARSV